MQDKFFFAAINVIALIHLLFFISDLHGELTTRFRKRKKVGNQMQVILLVSVLVDERAFPM